MTEQTLIERLKELRDEGVGGRFLLCGEYAHYREALSEAIAALSPVLPEQLLAWIDRSRTASLPHGLNDDGQILRQLECIADARHLIERLAVEKQYEINWREQLQGEIATLQQRLKEHQQEIEHQDRIIRELKND